jgi:hypothetical protein
MRLTGLKRAADHVAAALVMSVAAQVRYNDYAQSFLAFKVAPESGHRSPDSDSAAGKLLSG